MMLIKQLLALFALICTLPASAQLVILQYHHISDSTPAVTSISPEGFAEHLKLLADEGMVVVDLKSALHKIQNGQALPEKAVAITFDDAYSSIFDNAFPLLKQRNWPFTVFVNSKPVDEQHSNFMSWDQLREMQRHKGLIANHGVSHPYLIDVPKNKSLEEWLDSEINGAEKRLHEMLGTSHKLFAYPYGEFNLEIANWLKEQGYIGIGQQSGAVGASSNFQALPRYPASGIYANIKTLRAKLYTLAFPINAEQFVEPVLSGNNPPELTLSFSSTDINVRTIQCYSGTEGAIPTRAERNDNVITLHIQARNAIKSGRDRYNCTAPSTAKPGWYYWYSQFWINSAVKNR